MHPLTTKEVIESTLTAEDQSTFSKAYFNDVLDTIIIVMCRYLQ
jgi:hypothetical protein